MIIKGFFEKKKKNKLYQEEEQNTPHIWCLEPLSWVKPWLNKIKNSKLFPLNFSKLLNLRWISNLEIFPCWIFQVLFSKGHF